MNNRSLMSLALAGIVVLMPLAALADPPAHAKGNKHAKHEDKWDDSKWEYKNSDKNWKHATTQNRLDSVLTRQLLSGRANALDPQVRSLLMSQKPLPPGIRKNLMRGKPLPPGIAKQVYNMPPSAYSYLGISPNAYRVGAVGRNMVLYDIASGVVRDILFNAF